MEGHGVLVGHFGHGGIWCLSGYGVLVEYDVLVGHGGIWCLSRTWWIWRDMVSYLVGHGVLMGHGVLVWHNAIRLWNDKAHIPWCRGVYRRPSRVSWPSDNSCTSPTTGITHSTSLSEYGVSGVRTL